MIPWMDGHLPYLLSSFYVRGLWAGSVVVMDNLPAHKLASIEPMIQAVGASVICLSPYSPDFNPIEAMLVTTQIFFAEVRSRYHLYD